MNDIILNVEDITYSVNKKNNFSGYESVEILKNISFEVERGKVLGISGQSGSGKSTLAKILAGVFPQTSGSIQRNFKNDWSKSLPKPLQILFQNDGELINPFRKVNAVLNEAYEIKLKGKKNCTLEIDQLFSRFNLNPQLKEHKGSQLSGGEKQRIALARIIITEPEILILDEPFASQDVESQLSILNIINKLNEELNLTIICISHDLNILKHFSDNLLIMYNGKIVESGFTKNVIEYPQNEYTKFLLSAQYLNLTEIDIQSFHNNYEQN
ncbi:MAG: ATP-binding cassette domain-containing protein [Ignavibacteriales bacterium]|nr:ATP-binding cassette domain-containing protein [Ignavibacteriales bacterium]